MAKPTIAVVAMATLMAACATAGSTTPSTPRLGPNASATIPAPTRVPVAACSVGADILVPEDVVAAPQMDHDAFLATDAGRIVEAFFVGGPGAPEDFVFSGSDGFSILDDGTVVSYTDGNPAGWILIEDGDVAGWGGCEPVRVDGDTVASRWRSMTPPTAADRRLRLAVDGGACVTPDGHVPATEIERIELRETAEAVTITAFVRQLPFPGVCAGVGTEVPVEVELDAPLGGRLLLDGGLIPPRPPLG